MLKSILFHITPKLPKIWKVAFAIGTLLIAVCMIAPVILELNHIVIDESGLVETLAPYICGAIAFGVICQMAFMMIKTGPWQIEANIIVEGKTLTESQSKAVRIALQTLSEAEHDGTKHSQRLTFASNYRQHAVEVLHLIQEQS